MFRDWIKKDSQFPPEKDRYHLYISWACPWACRTALVRELKGLQDVISMSTVDYFLGSEGWTFSEENADPNNGFGHLKQVYEQSDAQYSGRWTVPVLYDKKQHLIVSNESSEIIRMLNDQFNDVAKYPSLELYPEAKRSEIDALNAWIYQYVNNGVYKCGFATSQHAYDAAFDQLFEHLEKLEEILSKQRFLTGSQFTEADVRLFTTLVRFDPVYAVHFKCNKKRLAEYPNLLAYTRDIYQLTTPAGAAKNTVNMFHIKHHYYESHTKINPYGIVAKGFDIDYEAPHGREKL